MGIVGLVVFGCESTCARLRWFCCCLSSAASAAPPHRADRSRLSNRPAGSLSGPLILNRLSSSSSLSSPRSLGTSCDPIYLEVFSNLFMSIAEQMGFILQNTAHSVNIKERLDFSCAIFDKTGQLIANAPHMPVHLGSMGESIKEVGWGNREGKVERWACVGSEGGFRYLIVRLALLVRLNFISFHLISSHLISSHLISPLSSLGPRSFGKTATAFTPATSTS